VFEQFLVVEKVDKEGEERFRFAFLADSLDYNYKQLGLVYPHGVQSVLGSYALYCLPKFIIKPKIAWVF
jgi:hypothetical protein